MKIELRDWNAKVQAMPRIPRAQTAGGYVNSLKTILKAIEEGRENQSIINIEGSKTTHSLDTLAIRIRPTGLVYQNYIHDKWHIHDEFKNWNEENNEYFIAIYLQAKIKYIAELLSFLQQPRNVNEMLEHAKSVYNLPWKEKSQIYDRLTWFMDLGLVAHISYERKYTLTTFGKEFLKQNPPTNPENIKAYIYDQTIEEEKINLEEWIKPLYEFEWNRYAERMNSIGYIPGGIKNSIHTILEVLDLSRGTTDFNTIYGHLNSTSNVKESSVGGFTSFLYNLKLLERKGEKIYNITNIGQNLLYSKNPDLDFVFVLHFKYRYVLEILFLIKDNSKSIQELAAVGVTNFGMENDKIEQIRKRINFLKNANLIIEESVRKYSLTNRGKLLIEELSSHINRIEEVPNHNENAKMPDVTQSNTYKLLQQARLASVDSGNPRNFEKILSLIFRKIGFDSELLGQSGKTDILLTAPTAPKFAYKVAVDAKTNRDGVITEGLIDFETLKEHREKHEVDYLIVVGKAFSENRLIKRAENNDIVLLDIDSLETLVKRHQEYPIQAIEYEIIFKYPGLVKIDLLDDIYNKMKRNKVLFKLIIDTLIQNSDDEFTAGILSTREIYLFIKDDDIFKNLSLKRVEIENMLGLLSNPLINCVGSTKDGYYAKGSLDDAALKFGFYFNVSSN